MGFGVGFSLGPVRVGAGVSSRTVAQGCLPLLFLAAVLWIVKAVLTALLVFFTWPARLVQPLARSAGLEHVYEVGLTWAAVALWVEILIVIVALFSSASAIRDLYLGVPGTKASARFWRFWAVALFPAVTAGGQLRPRKWCKSLTR